jgi:DNA primase
MCKNDSLIILLESILNKGKLTGNNNMSFFCPFCHHSKRKLEVQLCTNEAKENPWHCWVCDTKGKTINNLFKKLKVSSNKFEELKLIIQPNKFEKYTSNDVIELPADFISLHLDNIKNLDKTQLISSKHALKFLYKRRITDQDIIKYNIGFCNKGPYADRVIIPSYNKNGSLNYFIARDYTNNLSQKYKNPSGVSSKNIIGWELYINWDAPIILVEGIFDALTIKRNVIPLFGKVIHGKLMEKLVKSSVDRIYIALDNDAKRDALKQAEMLMSYGKEVYIVEMEGKDANEIGFEQFLKTIEQTYPLNLQSLLEKKLQLI